MQYLGALTDVIHALLMIAWIAGLPLLFWHRYPKVTLIYCCYSILFILINQISQWVLNECIFTTIARYFWSYGPTSHDVNEWFSVRFVRVIFGLTPTHRVIKRLTEILIAIFTLGGMYFSFKLLRK